jgi:DNA repair exonuclease SbcCD nuclease subunit
VRVPLRILHTSDVHLDDGAAGALAHRAFSQVVDLVAAERVDLFLIAGDLFDHNRVSGEVIDFVHRELARVQCPTVLIPGNHDCYNERSILRRLRLSEAGEHVFMIAGEHGEVLELPQLHATIWGRGLIEHEPGNKPLLGVPERRRDLWHIGMAHGYYVDYPEPVRSSLITPREIEESGLDYLALGHVHMFTHIRHGDTVACYCGSPSSAYAGSQGGTVALVDLLPGEAVRVESRQVGDPWTPPP